MNNTLIKASHLRNLHQHPHLLNTLKLLLLRSIQYNQCAKGHRIVRSSYVPMEIDTR